MAETAQEKIIVANWKANFSYSKAENWLQHVTANYSTISGLKIVIAAPDLFLFDLQKQFGREAGIAWAAQDVSSYPQGNYTGSLPAAWLQERVEYVLVGHRERRKYFHENIQDVANKITEALEEQIIPIVCLDLDIARQQAAAIGPEELSRLMVAYTPADAEQLEISRKGSTVAEGIAKMTSIFPGVPILYGGGVNENNAAELLTIPGLDGVMVAGGCLDPLAFVRLLNNAGSVVATR